MINFIQHEYVYVRNVVVSKLDREIQAVNVTLGGKFKGVSSFLGKTTIVCSAVLTGEEKDILDQLIMDHDETTPDSMEKALIDQAKSMGYAQKLIIQFGAENNSMGLTGPQVTAIMMSLASVQGALLSGSLRTARYLISTLPDMIGVDQVRRDRYVNQINEFLLTL